VARRRLGTKYRAREGELVLEKRSRPSPVEIGEKPLCWPPFEKIGTSGKKGDNVLRKEKERHPFRKWEAFRRLGAHDGERGRNGAQRGQPVGGAEGGKINHGEVK